MGGAIMGNLYGTLTAHASAPRAGMVLVPWIVPVLFLAGAFVNQGSMADRLFGFTPGDNAFAFFVVRVTAATAALLHLFVCGLLAALVATGARVMLGKQLPAWSVMESIGEAHVPLVLWVVWTGYMLNMAPIPDLDALAGIVGRIHTARTLAYAAAVLLLSQRLSAKCRLTQSEGWAAVLPPVCMLVCGLWSVNAVMALIPG